jgi:UDP-N-acetylglucosamine--N-acetylmuramyl-(pentapeptide) pyrophosphoryl-undecaprenol N-acetylglucosamine transferase
MKSDFEKMKYMQVLEWIYQEDIVSLLSHTHLVITRGSATTLAELDIFGVKKVIIPLPHSADNHQYWNAKEYEKKGDILLKQEKLSELSRVVLSSI